MIRFRGFTSSTEPICPFGKHRGQPLSAIPVTYLLWMLSMDNLDPGLRIAVRDQAMENGMPFGKHRNVPFSSIPGDYLQWCLGNMELRDDLEGLIRYEIDRRNGTYTEDH